MKSESFLSAGQKIRIESFGDEGAMGRPALLILHGAGGIDHGNQYVRHLATALATHGYATYLVHYFDRSRTRYADDATIRRHFDHWVQTVSDAVTFIAGGLALNAQSIASCGYSLGAYVALGHAALDARIRAVVELAGGVDPEHAKGIRRLPPTLILHGAADRRVPVARAEELEALLRSLNVPFEKQIYPGEGHILTPMSAMDALTRAVRFLHKHLVDAGRRS